jgi:hypothetical protein
MNEDGTFNVHCETFRLAYMRGTAATDTSKAWQFILWGRACAATTISLHRSFVPFGGVPSWHMVIRVLCAVNRYNLGMAHLGHPQLLQYLLHTLM